MQFIDRSSANVPRVLQRGTRSKADLEFEKASSFYAAHESTSQRGFQFTAFRDSTVRRELHALFHGKCAYCERLLDSQEAEIDQFRPKLGLINQDGRHLPRHYWWLANEWSNLYLSCRTCNAAKGSRFPLADEAERAIELANGNQLLREKPLLLDPCDPVSAQRLIFLEDGSVASSDPAGQTTIELMRLNRPSLVEQRLQFARQIFALLQNFERSGSRGSKGAAERHGLLQLFRKMTRPSAQFATMARQLIRARVTITDAEDMLDQAAGSSPAISKEDQKRAKADLRDYRQAQENFSLEDGTGLEKFVQRDRWIRKISLRDIGPINRLDLMISEPAERQPWLMILGENATGKSSILKAVALALIGEKYFAEVIRSCAIDLAGLVREGTDFGEIRIYLTGTTEPRTLRIPRYGQPRFTGRAAQTLLLAYGSTRLLPRTPEVSDGTSSYARVENLFDPFLPLGDAEQWLASTTDANFTYAARGLKTLLDIPAHHDFRREDGNVFLMEGAVRVPLPRLCDGYQTVLALYADILQIVMQRWPTPEDASGIVLIDEVGTHLHPSWKLRFVERLRALLPRIQVIATTHEPLCLRGLGDDEIAVLRRGPRGGVRMITDLPPISGMRIDQILTSEHFGLHSTLDPGLQGLFDEYQALLRRGASKSHPERLTELQGRIDSIQQIGDTVRERMMLGAIDRYLVERTQLAEKRAIERAETFEAELKSIWLEAPVIETTIVEGQQ